MLLDTFLPAELMQIDFNAYSLKTWQLTTRLSRKD